LGIGALALVGCSDSHGAGGDGGGEDAGGTSGLDLCETPDDCVVVPASCCGTCGEPTRGDAVALNRASASTYRDMACGDDFACPACAGMPDPTLLATCEANRCVVVDLQAHVSTECGSDADCRVRTADCCECGGATDPASMVAIAIDDAAAFEALVCGGDFGCPECAPAYPASYSAVCDAGRCRFVP